MSDEINKFRIEQGLLPHKEAKRRCLSCSTDFDSWGVDNRICSPCKVYQEEDEGYSYKFDDSNVDFQYDLTISQIIKMNTNSGVYVDTYDKKGFYKKEAQKDYRKKT